MTRTTNRFRQVMPLMALPTLTLLLALAAPAYAAEPPFLRGVDLASGSFGSKARPGVYGKDYIYADASSVTYYQSKGFNLFRVSFFWERVQPTLKGPLAAAELARLDNLVAIITNRGLYALLDVHNYAKYYGVQVGAGVPLAAFRDLWSKLAAHYKNNPRVMFDLMNEPNNMPTSTLHQMMATGLRGIRDRGATNTVFIEGNHWSSGEHWLDSNSDSLADLAGPNVIFEPHQYLNRHATGTRPTCVSTTIGVDKLQDITNWARTRGVRLVLGEFGAGANDICRAAVTGLLNFIESNKTVWRGWIWWAGGPWWGNYFTSIEPNGGVEKPQMDWLEPFLP
jgi:endoglucanase